MSNAHGLVQARVEVFLSNPFSQLDVIIRKRANPSLASGRPVPIVGGEAGVGSIEHPEAYLPVAPPRWRPIPLNTEIQDIYLIFQSGLGLVATRNVLTFVLVVVILFVSVTLEQEATNLFKPEGVGVRVT